MKWFRPNRTLHLTRPPVLFPIAHSASVLQNRISAGQASLLFGTGGHTVRTVAFWVCVTTGLAGGCSGGNREGSDWHAGPEEWHRSPPDGAFFSAPEAKRLGADEFGVVVAGEDRALKRLADAPWVELSAREAEDLLGHPLAGDGGRLVLLRGLALSPRGDAFSVTWRGGAVRVYQLDHVIGRLRLSRRGIVARLPGLPEEVYVNYSVAE